MQHEHRYGRLDGRQRAAAANILQDKVGAAVAWLSAVVPGGRAGGR